MDNKSIGGGSVPYGYRVDRQSYLVPYKKEAAIVKYIFKLALRGHSYAQIATDLNDRKFKTKRGKDWSYQQVKQLIKNPCYKGERRFKGENAPIRRLVVPKVWQEVNANFDSRKGARLRESKVNDMYLKGILRCWKCNNLYTARWRTNRLKGYYIHRCTNTQYHSVDSNLIHKGVEMVFSTWYPSDLEYFNDGNLDVLLLDRDPESYSDLSVIVKAIDSLKKKESLEREKLSDKDVDRTFVNKELRSIRGKIKRLQNKLLLNPEYYQYDYNLGEMEDLAADDKKQMLFQACEGIWVKPTSFREVIVQITLNHEGFQKSDGSTSGFALNYKDVNRPKFKLMDFR